MFDSDIEGITHNLCQFTIAKWWC